MEENFYDIIDYKFTANMETDLDKIEDGTLEYLDVLSDFWKDFAALGGNYEEIAD